MRTFNELLSKFKTPKSHICSQYTRLSIFYIFVCILRPINNREVKYAAHSQCNDDISRYANNCRWSTNVFPMNVPSKQAVSSKDWMSYSDRKANLDSENYPLIWFG